MTSAQISHNCGACSDFQRLPVVARGRGGAVVAGVVHHERVLSPGIAGVAAMPRAAVDFTSLRGLSAGAEAIGTALGLTEESGDVPGRLGFHSGFLQEAQVSKPVEDDDTALQDRLGSVWSVVRRTGLRHSQGRGNGKIGRAHV